MIAALAIAGCETRSPPERDRVAARDRDDEEADRTRICPDGKCLPVPEGIRGLAFGMSRDQASRTVGRLRPRRPQSRTVVSGDCSERHPAPGARTRVVTSIGSENATCDLWFIDDRLELIDCDLDARRARDDHIETVWLLYRSLATQYGQAHSLSDRLTSIGRLEAIWTSDAAELIVSADLHGKRSTIDLVNRSARYNREIELQIDGVRIRCEAEKAARERAAKEKERERRQRAKSFEDDLRPSLERPRPPAD